MKLRGYILGGFATLFAVTGAAAQADPAPDAWSGWMSKRGHFQFQLRTEQVGPTVMKVHMRVRPDVQKIQAEPSYNGESYYLEYYQGIGSQSTGGLGALTAQAPRRIMFPPNAPETCVFEEEDIYAIIEPPGRDVRLYMDPAVTPLPILEQYGEKLSGFDMVVSFGTNVGPGAVVRFSGVSMQDFQKVC